MIEQHRLLNEVSSLVDAGVPSTTLTHIAGALRVPTLVAVHRTLESGKSIGNPVLEVA